MVQVKEVDDKKIWEKFVQNFAGANFLQSWNWGEFHQVLGHQISRVGFFQAEKLVGVMQAIVEKGKRATYLTVPGGPLINWEEDEVKGVFLEAIKRMAGEYKCSFVRVRPQMKNNETNNKMFIKFGFVMAPMHLHAQLTLKLDLSKTDEQLMAEMRKATRYEIRQAIKMGIIIEESTDPEDMNAFYDLQVSTSARQAFVPFSKKYLKEQFKAFVNDDQVVLFTAKYEGKILAQAMVIFYGQEADYHYGASSEEGRKYPGAYLIQWQAMKEARKRGLKYYDLWGIAPGDKPKHRFYGVSLFKRGFGGEEMEYLHARDLVISRPRYLINWGIEEWRRRSRKL